MANKQPDMSYYLTQLGPPFLPPPPPRPVSVNSLAPSSSAVPPKTSRSTSAEIPLHDGSTTLVARDSPKDTVMEDAPSPDQPSEDARTRFVDLPIEIHEVILDYLFGERTSPVGAKTPGTPTVSWSKAMRHPRRKVLSNLSLILRVWRPLVQDRLYRHSKSRYVVLINMLIGSQNQRNNRRTGRMWSLVQYSS